MLFKKWESISWKVEITKLEKILLYNLFLKKSKVKYHFMIVLWKKIKKGKVINQLRQKDLGKEEDQALEQALEAINLGHKLGQKGHMRWRGMINLGKL
jgi:hypothetical protein